MKSKAIATSALLFALSLSTLSVMAASDVSSLPLMTVCPDSQSTEWGCAEVAGSSSTELRHPLAEAIGQGAGHDEFYNSEIVDSCDLCFND